MLNHVLVPLDGSKLAEAALAYARSLVEPAGKLTLLNILVVPQYPIYDFYPGPGSVVQEFDQTLKDMIPKAKGYLEEIATGLRNAGLQVDTRVMIGDPAETIVEVGGEIGVNAIAMSTHGRSGLSRWLFGSVTNKVLGASCCPVFVVPSRAIKEEEAESKDEVLVAH
jgi:nucleotide-binding universal stress UspA family protein